jgi:predicted dehydrogenase
MINIGLIGAATITPRSIICPSKKIDDISIYGLASRNETKASEFALKYDIKHVFHDYDSLIRSSAVDAVYIALSNDLHAFWTIEAAKAKKHILVEKPLCLNTKEMIKVMDAVKKNNVFLLEGVMVQHHPWQAKIKEFVQKKAYGNILTVTTRLTFILPRDQNYRFMPEKGGGIFWDESCYWCQFLQTLGDLSPVKVSGYSTFNGPNGIDTTFEASMALKDGLSCDLLCSYEMPYDATHILTFENAKMRIRNFLAPSMGNFKIKIDIAPLDTDLRDMIVFEPENYFYNQLRFFTDVIKGEKENIPLETSYQRIEIMERIYNQAKNSGSVF